MQSLWAHNRQVYKLYLNQSMNMIESKMLIYQMQCERVRVHYYKYKLLLPQLHKCR